MTTTDARGPPMDEDLARRAVRRAVEAKGGRKDFADSAGIDSGTLTDFLEGIRWPHPKTRSKIETALGWPAGRILDIAEGVASEYVSPEVDLLTEVFVAIDRQA